MSGDHLKKGSTLVAWPDNCLPKKEGDLGLMNLFSLNQSLLLKRCWDMTSGGCPSSICLENRLLKCGMHKKNSYKVSSVWLGLKKQWDMILQKARSVIGNGEKFTSGLIIG